MLALKHSIIWQFSLSMPVSVKDCDTCASHRLTDYRLGNFCTLWVQQLTPLGICNTLHYLAELCMTLKSFHMKKRRRKKKKKEKKKKKGKGKKKKWKKLRGQVWNLLTDLGTRPRLPRAGQHILGFPLGFLALFAAILLAEVMDKSTAFSSTEDLSTQPGHQQAYRTPQSRFVYRQLTSDWPLWWPTICPPGLWV